MQKQKLSYFEEHADDNDRDKEEDELFEIPGCPEDPLMETHHQHGLPNTSLLLKNQLLTKPHQLKIKPSHLSN